MFTTLSGPDIPEIAIETEGPSETRNSKGSCFITAQNHKQALHSNVQAGYSYEKDNTYAAQSGLVAGIKLLTRYQTRKMISGCHPRASQEKHASENGGMLSSPV